MPSPLPAPESRPGPAPARAAHGGPAPARRPRPALRLAAATAVAALVGAGCSGAGHRGSPPADPAATGVPATTPTTEAAPTFAPSPYSWTEASAAALHLGGGAGTTLSAVIAPQLTGPWVVVGTRTSATGTPTGTEWTSTDTRTWTSVALSPTLSRALAATQYKGATTVVGAAGEGANQQATAWYSPSPGAPFEAADVPLTGGASTMTTVTAGSLGLFASGTVDGRFAMWSSSDGRHWIELPEAERVITSVAGARVEALAAVGNDVFAAGSVRPGPTTQAAVWSSTDGLHWHMVSTASTAFSGAGDRVIYSLAPLLTGLVAVGAIDYGHGWVPASWISPDGLSWSPPATDFPGLTAPATGVYGVAGGAAARSVAAIPTLAGATALIAAGGGPSGQQAWKSTDGMHWTPVGIPAAQAGAPGWRAGAVAATTDTTVVIDSDPGRPYVLVDSPSGWAQPSGDPRVFGPVRPAARPVALGRSGADLVLDVAVDSFPQVIGAPTTRVVGLASSDGIHWAGAPATVAISPRSLPAAGTVATRSGSGWVAAGPVGRPSPQSWTSADGVTWLPAGPLDSAAADTSGPSAGRSTVASTAPAAVSGVCAGVASGPAGAGSSGTLVDAAVGAVATPGPVTPSGAATGRAPVAWVSTAGTAWHRAQVQPATPAGSVAAMVGCRRTASGLIAFGTAAGSGGAPVPGLWRSSDGATWSALTASGFAVDAPNPIVSLATDGGTWLAAANPDPSGGVATGATAGRPVGPATAVDSDALVGPVPAGTGSTALWLSTDGGGAWQLIDTQIAPWAATEHGSVDLVGFAGSRPVVVGVVDGRLTVWTGYPSAAGSAGS